MAKEMKNVAKPSAAPVAEKKPRKAVKKPKYAIPEGGLDNVPADYDPKKFAPLVRKNFKDESNFWLYRADLLERKAKFLRDYASKCKIVGQGAEKVKAKRLLAMKSKMAALMDDLRAQLGEDKLNELLATQVDAPVAAT